VCAGDVSLAQSNAAELRKRPAQLAPQIRAQLLARLEDLLLRVVARAAKPEDLGSMDAAAAVNAPDRLSATPPLHRLRPLLGQVVLSE
jgi:hypothetical protein